MSTHADMLADVPLFALLDDQERSALAERLDVATFAAGTCIFSRGDPGDTLFIVRRGAVELWFKNDSGERMVLETALSGDFFGDLSLLDGGPRTTSALVVEDLEALVIDRGDLDEFLHARPAAALDFLAATGRRLRETSDRLRHAASRDTNLVEADKRTRVMIVADWISDFSGSLPFLFIHIVIFFVWIILNVKPLSETPIGGFDAYPFGLLTMVVSLEAIILSVFVLLSQNRQVARDRVRNDIEYSVNLKAELEIAHLHEKLDRMNDELLARLDTLQKSGSPVSPIARAPSAKLSPTADPPEPQGLATRRMAPDPESAQ